MPQVRFCKHAEKKHSPLSTIAAGAIASLPGEGTVFVCDEGETVNARRSDDVLITLARGAIDAIEPVGANGVRITYTDPTSPALTAAIIAAARQSHVPVVADPASLALMMLAERVARSDIPVLIGGPTGTGKEVLSRFMHQTSGRADGPFVAVNCAAMPETMLEAMLFGHRKGAFTGATEAAEGFFRAADGGTLLLDEIAEMPLALQAKLLRALQEGEVVPIGATKPIKVDVRVIACANRDLPHEVAEGRFRADLYYRLNVFPLALPPLRERTEDIAPLAFAMVLRHGAVSGQTPWLTAGALAKLQQHVWPGNVREMENVIRRALLLAGDAAQITHAEIVFDQAARSVPITRSVETAPVTPLTVERAGGSSRLATIVREFEAEAIMQALEEFDGNRLRTARKLGISERTLRYRLAHMRDAGICYAGASR